MLTENPGTYVRAWEINNSSLVVGELRDASDTQRFATLWVNDAEDWANIDLQTLIPADSGWDLSGALSINDAGQIVGYGVVDNEQRAFLLTPTAIPEPSTSVAVVLAAATLGILGRLKGSRE